MGAGRFAPVFVSSDSTGSALESFPVFVGVKKLTVSRVGSVVEGGVLGTLPFRASTMSVKSENPNKDDVPEPAPGEWFGFLTGVRAPKACPEKERAKASSMVRLMGFMARQVNIEELIRRKVRLIGWK